MKHQHKYDKDGKQLCCTQEEKIYTKAGAKKLLKGHHENDGHDHSHSDDDGHNHDHSNVDIEVVLQSVVFNDEYNATVFLCDVAVGHFHHHFRLAGAFVTH